MFHLILTLDYELFGNGSGCLKHCVVKPTEQCLSSLNKHSAHMDFFVDASEFIALNRYPEFFAEGMASVEQQLSEAAKTHSLQLHLHPQWLDAEFNGKDWQLQLDKWRIGDLSDADIERCTDEALQYIRSLLPENNDRHCKVFRAGGWAIQSNPSVYRILSDRGIVLESTVAPEIYNPSKGDWFDFRGAPKLPCWPIMDDLMRVAPSGAPLVEVPIATARVGRQKHLQAIKQHRSEPPFPSGCSGSYAGPNSKWQSIRGKISKLMRAGTAMLDFSTMPGWLLIELTQRYMEQQKNNSVPVPIVAIGHNKNFTSASNGHLQEWLQWVAAQPNVEFSSYATWYGRYQQVMAT